MNRLNKRKTALIGILTALALVLSYVELLLPVFFFIPGAKLGLANLVTVLLLYQYDAGTAAGVSFFRVLAAGFLFGSLSGILYSLSGAVLSLAVMALLKRKGRFSVRGVSTAGGIAHNIGQLFTATAVLESPAVLYYLPFLLAAGAATGFLNGTAAGEILKRTGAESL